MDESFLFTFKKIVSVYLNPITIGLEIVIIGVVMIVFSRRKPKREPKPWWRTLKKAAGDIGLFLCVFGCFFIYMCSIKPVSDSLLYALEKEHPPLAPVDSPGFKTQFEEMPRHIVVLAGGARFHEDRSPTSQLTPQSTARVLEGIRLHQVFPDASFIVTGTPNETEGMAQMAELFGVPKRQIIKESESRDTKDHPKFVKPLLRDDPFLLVTSAAHMKRSYALFQKQELDPIAAPCDFWAFPRFETFDFSRPDLFVPRTLHLYKTDIAFHEYIGLAWAALRKQTGPGKVEQGIEAPEKEPEEKPVLNPVIEL